MVKKDIKQANELMVGKSRFSEWYSQILLAADIIDKRYNVKGGNVWLNYGYGIMLNIKNYLDELFKNEGIKEMYFPLLVPVEYCEKNEKWWKGFKNQAFWVRGGAEKEEYILRPTGEPAMYPMFKTWIRTFGDLPLKIYETVSSFRYETKQTRPLIRDREITVWHEIHTAHSTQEEAEEEALNHKKMYDKIWERCALSPLVVRKPLFECFPGAIGAFEYYNLMPNGKVMENGSINNLGQAYAKKFGIKFKNNTGKEDFAWMICTGNGARLLAAVISVHGDDNGLILPPEIAPIQVIIVPIFNKKNKNKVFKKVESIKKELEKLCIRVQTDLRDESAGKKFYDWEIKGVPLRIEIGPRDIAKKSVMLVRRDNEVKKIMRETQLKQIVKILENIQKNLLEKSKKELKTATTKTDNLEKLKTVLKKNKIGKVFWCGSESCWDKIKSIEEGVELFGTDLKSVKGKCIICKKISKEQGYVANTY